MAEATQGDFLGTGWAFPVSGRSGRIATVSDDADIAQAILLILRTDPGERVMLPEFGSDLHALVFAPNDTTTRHLAEIEVRRALERWEPRIVVTEVTASADPAEPGRMLISIDYLIRQRNSRHNLVYPFYLDATP